MMGSDFWLSAITSVTLRELVLGPFYSIASKTYVKPLSSVIFVRRPILSLFPSSSEVIGSRSLESEIGGHRYYFRSHGHRSNRNRLYWLYLCWLLQRPVGDALILNGYYSALTQWVTHDDHISKGVNDVQGFTEKFYIWPYGVPISEWSHGFWGFFICLYFPSGLTNICTEPPSHHQPLPSSILNSRTVISEPHTPFWRHCSCTHMIIKHVSREVPALNSLVFLNRKVNFYPACQSHS